MLVIKMCSLCLKSFSKINSLISKLLSYALIIFQPVLNLSPLFLTGKLNLLLEYIKYCSINTSQLLRNYLWNFIVFGLSHTKLLVNTVLLQNLVFMSPFLSFLHYSELNSPQQLMLFNNWKLNKRHFNFLIHW